MIILLSPSKTQNAFDQRVFDYMDNMMIFPEATHELVKSIKTLDKKELSETMKIKDDLLDKTYQSYKGFYKQKMIPSIYSYSGAVYQNADIHTWTEKEIAWVNEHLMILSALYGVTKPLQGICNHRLDMKMKIKGVGSLYGYWGDKIDCLLKSREKSPLIINLASKEYSQMVGLNMLNIAFKSEKNGTYKTIGTYSKMARGMFLKYIVQNSMLLDQLEKNNDNQAIYKFLTKFSESGYQYNDELSDFNNMTFIKG